MMYYMNTKDFENIFLENETDKDILASQYVLVSSRVRSGGRYKNVLSCYRTLYPSTYACGSLSKSEFKARYYKDLEQYLAFLANLVGLSIQKNMNIIFLCTKKETKMYNYIELLSIYIYINFGYPVYNYKDYSLGKCSLIEYDKDKVLKKCKSIINNTKEENFLLKPAITVDKGKKKFYKKNKKYLIKYLKDQGVYEKGLSLYDLIDLYELYHG